MASLRVLNRVGDDKLNDADAFDLFDTVHKDGQATNEQKNAAALDKARVRYLNRVGDDKLTPHRAFEQIAASLSDISNLPREYIEASVQCLQSLNGMLNQQS